MDRTLSFYPFFAAVMTIVGLMVICLFNMHLLAKHKTSCLTISIHIVSLFAIVTLLFHMMSASVFVLPLSNTYRFFSRISLFLLLLSIGGSVIRILAWGRSHGFRVLSQNIPDALLRIEDVVFVIDRDGIITHINHPEKYNTLFGGIETMEQLRLFMETNCSADWKSEDKLECLSDMVTCELFFEGANMSFVFQLSPLIIAGGRLGYTAVLRDVSAIKDSEKILQEQNEYLKQANRKLSHSIQVAGALEAETERFNILEHVQLTVIQDIEKAMSTIQDVKQHCFENGTYQTAMKDLAAQLRRIYQDVRGAVGKIAGKEV